MSVAAEVVCITVEVVVEVVDTVGAEVGIVGQLASYSYLPLYELHLMMHHVHQLLKLADRLSGIVGET